MVINKHPGLSCEHRQILIGAMLDRFVPRLPVPGANPPAHLHPPKACAV